MKNHVKQTAWLIIGAMIALAFSASVQAASFDCAKASTKVEHIICDNHEISRLDEDMAATYKAATQDKAKAESVRQAQKQWLKERNACPDLACIRNAYVARLKRLESGPAGMNDTGQVAEGDSQSGQQYRFQLTKGKGVAVCDAYLARLNATHYEQPPYCGRPENNTVSGFARLKRVPVPASIANDLYPIVGHFMLGANQKNLDWTDMSLQERIASANKGTPAGMQEMLTRDRDWAKVWGYDPPVDIDNDGMPDNVEIWHGSVLPHGVGGKECGADLEDKFPGLTSLRQPQVAFVITGNNRLNVQKTENVFAHPADGYRFYDSANKEWKTSGDFRPIGTSIGIF